MGYTTDFSGTVEITPPLNADEISFLKDLATTRRMHRSGGPLFVKGEGAYGQGNGPDTIHNHNQPDPDQPGLWCQWTPSDDGHDLEWDGGEKFYNSVQWMEYIVRLLSDSAYVKAHVNEDERLKNFTCEHVVNGEIHASGEDTDDVWKLVVTNNVVKEVGMVFADEVEVPTPPPTETELREALRSLGAKQEVEVQVWTLTVDQDYSIVTSVHPNEQDLYDMLRENYAAELPEGVDADVLVETLEEQGLVWHMDQHNVKVVI